MARYYGQFTLITFIYTTKQYIAKIYCLYSYIQEKIQSKTFFPYFFSLGTDVLFFPAHLIVVACPLPAAASPPPTVAGPLSGRCLPARLLRLSAVVARPPSPARLLAAGRRPPASWSGRRPLLGLAAARFLVWPPPAS
jgi:hypothetical protein